MQKKILALVLIIVMTFSLCSCDSNEGIQSIPIDSSVLADRDESVGLSEPAETSNNEMISCSDNEDDLADYSDSVSYLVRDDWAPNVKAALNSFIATYGADSPEYDDSTNVVFDFDNTTAVFDIEEQLSIYQLQHMAFALNPEQLSDVLCTQLSDLDQELTESEFPDTTYTDWITDITKAYKSLYTEYGPFTAQGLSDQASADSEASHV